tara:strand:- start:259 stop:480 length:222 start_codon:yes stop_codon:yes gene_type:complete
MSNETNENNDQSVLAALLDSVLDPLIERWGATYKKARKEMPDGAEVYGSGYGGIVDGLTIAKVQLKKALIVRN